MSWCLIGVAILAALVGIGVLTVRVPRPDLRQVRPGRAMRGCIATMALLTALGLIGLALLIGLR